MMVRFFVMTDLGMGYDEYEEDLLPIRIGHAQEVEKRQSAYNFMSVAEKKEAAIDY